MAGGHTTESPDGAWTVSIMDGPISSGAEGVRMMLYRGERPISPSDQVPALTFEAPLRNFDARASSTTGEWSKDGSECRFKLATDRGEALLVVAPAESRIVFDSQPPPEAVQSSNILPWILLVMTLILWTGLNRTKRPKPQS
jgi:hypothetical protein